MLGVPKLNHRVNLTLIYCVDYERLVRLPRQTIRVFEYYGVF
jgi:hypothetical protein